MRTRSNKTHFLLTSFLVSVLLVLGCTEARAHCDTMDGPVVKDAQEALASGEVMPALKWVSQEDEAEVREAFRQTLVVREKGPEARELADRYFFETVVRLHRKSEGAPYTGLKPAGTDPGAAITAADQALEVGSAEALVGLITKDAAQELRASFTRVYEAKERAGESVAAGRDYVEAYVHFIHLAEQIHRATTGEADAHGAAPGHL